MSFTFNFGFADDKPAEEEAPTHIAAPFKNVLPTSLCDSYPVIADIIRISESESDCLFKRNVADVKFEVAATDDMEASPLPSQSGAAAVRQSIVSGSDLIAGVYEGGLKTWEGVGDLIGVLMRLTEEGQVHLDSKKVLEIGCGSGLPGIWCVQKGAEVDFQDYNEDVLQLVTIPNVLLNTVNKPTFSSTDATVEHNITPPAIPTSCHFYAGDWTNMSASVPPQQYDIILASETIYTASSYASQLSLMKHVIKQGGVAYVAAKGMYFGCSGSLEMFVRFAESQGVAVERIWRGGEGVGREVVKLSF
ncbi:Histidine protein methyltransferase 1 [Gaertneriomyces sp. JEL0708]|nr:Histidine protein methyltransferase 1 [Gaertneriomyces sp. JEL0708]